MTQKKVPPTERIAASFKKVSAASADLHAASTELNQNINALTEALQMLDLGVAAWHRIAGGRDDENGYYWSRDVGYALVRDDWRIALRKVEGNEFADRSYSETVWSFDKAPHFMRIESIAKLPDLLDELHERIVETTAKLKTRSEQTQEFVAAVAQIVGQAEPTQAA